MKLREVFAQYEPNNRFTGERYTWRAEQYSQLKHDREQLDGLRDYIAQHGLDDPMLLEDGPITLATHNGRSFVQNGHHRIIAAKRLRLTHIPVRIFNYDND